MKKNKNLNSAASPLRILRLVILGVALSAQLAFAIEPDNVRERFFAQLEAENNFGAYEIDCESKGSHTLILTGSVSSSASRNRAEELARRTEGVETVENKLVVAPQSLSAESRNQQKVIAATTAKISARKDLGKFQLQIKQNRDSVAISGLVTTLMAKNEIERMVREELKAGGVITSAVVNSLQVSTSVDSDQILTERVTRALERAGISESILASANRGTITVSGPQADHRVRDQILATVLNVPGVTDVRSQMQ